MSGVPNEHAGAVLTKAFLEDATRKQWQMRQDKILRSELTTRQQDFILRSFLLRACSSDEKQRLDNNHRDRVSPLSGPIFEVLPEADTGAVQVLLRTLTGLEDFARTNAHHSRRKIHPDLSNDQLKHCCLYCLINQSELTLKLFIDSMNHCSRF